MRRLMTHGSVSVPEAGAAEAGLPEAISRSRQVVTLLAALWLLNGFDLTMTVLAHQQGVLEELNPVVDFLLLTGTPAVVLFKISLVTFGSCFLYRYRDRRLTLSAVGLLVLVYACLAVHWHYCFQWYEITLLSGWDARIL